MSVDRARARGLAKLFTQTTTAGGGAPSSVNPTYFYHQAALHAPPSHFGRVGAPTGTYPYHYFKNGAGKIAVQMQQRGVMPNPISSTPAPAPGGAPRIQ